MTAAKKFVNWALLLGFALALRLGLALGSPNVFFPDEIFQTLEPAHRLVYGYGVISWEWRLGIRSWVLPTFLAGVMRATAWLHAGPQGYLTGITVVLSLLSLTTVWFGYAWAKRASGNTAAIVAALACSFFFGLVYFAPKALNEVVAAHVMLPGLYFGVYGEKIGERKRLFFAGLLCALAACLRIQLLPAMGFALVYFCFPQWRKKMPWIAAGAAIPVALYGVVDWITWSSPWESFVGYYTANMVHGQGKELTSHDPWYWYLLVLIVLLGPVVLLLFHGVRRSPFLAILCTIIVASHSIIPHKEIRFIYPILAPALTMAAMGIVDLLAEIKGGMAFLDNPRWVGTIAVIFFLVSSGLLTAHCEDWFQTPWGVGAFDRLSSEPALCGVGIYDRIWWESGGYTHLHRNVPILQVNNPAELSENSDAFNALIAPQEAKEIPAGFSRQACWKGVCLLQRPGACKTPRPNMVLNEYLKSIGQ